MSLGERREALFSAITLAVLVTLVGSETLPGARALALPADPVASELDPGLVDSLVAPLPRPLQDLVRDALDRNPQIARMRRRAAALSFRPDQAGSLPDPMANVNLFVLPPETRTGPQRLLVSLAQRFPWFGKLSLKRQMAVLEAEAAAADAVSAQLDVTTQLRRLYYELAFQQELLRIVGEERQTLRRHEEAARARYSTGMGLQQEIVRIQAQLTRVETRQLDIRERSATLRAQLNALCDRPSDTPIDDIVPPRPRPPQIVLDDLRRLAESSRPELLSADAMIAHRQTGVEMAKKDFRPDFTLGLAATVVDRRGDPAGRAMPPPDNGDDIVALMGSVNLPVYRRRLNAALSEALEQRSVAEETKRQLEAEIERSIGDLVTRLPMLFEHGQLLQNVLLVQAEEALSSAETAYTTGRLNAVDLLDAEVVLFDVQRQIARTRTDYAVAAAELERATAQALPLLEP